MMIEEKSGMVVETRYSKWQKKSVRCFIVNSRSKYAAQRSISAAIREAEPYDMIELVGGEYFETFAVTFPLEFQSAEGEDAVLTFRGPSCQIAVDTTAYFNQIIFASKSKTKADAAVVVSNGTPIFERCQFSSFQICGHGRPELRRCEISNSLSGTGLRVIDRGGGTIHDCNIHSHSNACVDVDSSGELSVTECTIYQPTRAMVVVCQGIVSDSKNLQGNENPDALACGKVSFTRNRFYSQQMLASEEQFGATRAQTGSGLTTGSGAALMSSFGETCCVYVVSGARPTFSFNEISEGDIGFIFEQGGIPRLQGNTIRAQRVCGIFVLLRETPTDDDVWENTNGIKISNGNVFERCRVGIDVQCGSPKSILYGEQTASVDPSVPQSKTDAVATSSGGVRPSSAIPRLRPPRSWTRTTDFDAIEDIDDPRESKERRANHDLLFHPWDEMHGKTKHYEDVAPLYTGLLKDVLLSFPLCMTTPDGKKDDTAFANTLESIGMTLQQRNDVRSDDIKRAVRRITLLSKSAFEVSDTRFLHCMQYGVRFRNGAGGTVASCHFESCGVSGVLADKGSYPLIVSSTFDSNNEAGIMVSNVSDPFAIGNEIKNSPRHGIVVQSSSMGLFMGNLVRENTGVGISIEGASSPIFFMNAIKSNKQSGMHILSSSKPLIAANEFNGNFVSQMHVASFASPYIFKNDIALGANVGVKFSQLGGGMLVGNHIWESAQDGVVVELDADPYLSHNRIRKNKGCGVSVMNNGLGTVVQNILDTNQEYNVRVSEGGDPTVRKNEIMAGVLGGICVCSEGLGNFERNVIHSNAVANVHVRHRYSKPMFRKNEIARSISGVGALTEEESNGIFRENVFSDHSICGIRCISGSTTLFDRNSVVSENVGIVVAEGGKGEFTGNEISSCFGCGVVIESKGSPKMVKNRVVNCEEAGIAISPEGMGHLLENTVVGNTVGLRSGCTTGTVAKFEVLLSRISVGASTEKTFAPCIVERNEISQNRVCGVLLESSASSRFLRNRIIENAHIGVLANVSFTIESSEKKGESRRLASKVGGGIALFEENEIRSHTSSNVHFANFPGDNDIRFEKNTISEAPMGLLAEDSSFIQKFHGNTVTQCQEGVVFKTNAHGNVTQCEFNECDLWGVYLSTGAHPHIHDRNKVFNCGICGILLDAASLGEVVSNSIYHNSIGLICLSSASNDGKSSSSQSLVKKNDIYENQVHGVLILSVSKHELLRNVVQSDDAEDDEVVSSSSGRSARFEENVMRRNRYCGVFHEHHETMTDLFGSHSQHADPLDASLSISSNAEMSPIRGKLNRKGAAKLGTKSVQSIKSPEGQSRGPTASSKARVLFTGCEMIENTIGFCTGSHCEPEVRKSTCSKNNFFGIIFRAAANGRVVDSTIEKNGLAGIYCSKFSQGVVETCTVRNNNHLSGQPKFFVAEILISSKRFFIPLSAEPESAPDRSRMGSSSLELSPKDLARRRSEVGKVSMCNSSHQQLAMLIDVHEAAFMMAVKMLSHVAATPVFVSPVLGGAVVSESHIRPSDGGIGIWVEEGSEVVCEGNTISRHNQCGILVSRGVQDHCNAIDNVPISLLAPSAVIGSKLNSGQIHPSSLFSPLALVTAHQSNQQDRSLTPESTPKKTAASTPKRTHGATPRKSQQTLDHSLSTTMSGNSMLSLLSGACCVIKKNFIEDNDCDGVRIQVFHRIHATKQTAAESQPQTSSDVAIQKGKGSEKGLTRKRTVGVEAPEGVQRKPEDILIPDLVESLSIDMSSSMFSPSSETRQSSTFLFDSDVANLKFSLVLEENKIRENRGRGVFFENVVEVLCSHTFLSDHYSVKRALHHGKQDEMEKVELPTPSFTLPKSSHLRHVQLLENYLSSNSEAQLETTAVFCIVAADKSRTHLASNVPSFTTLSGLVRNLGVQGSLIVEKNRVESATTGVTIGPYSGNGLFRANVFCAIREEAIKVSSESGSGSVGSGNNFDNCGIGIRVCSSNEESSSTAQIRTQPLRIFKNEFNANVVCGILVEGGNRRPVHMVRNTFSNHGVSSVGTSISGPLAAATVVCNAFTGNIVGMCISNSAGSLSEKTVVLRHNHFDANAVGCLCTGGSVPFLEENLFSANTRAGCEIVGLATSPTGVSNVFEGNVTAIPGSFAESTEITMKVDRFVVNQSEVLKGVVLVDIDVPSLPKFIHEDLEKNGDDNSKSRVPQRAAAGLVCRGHAGGVFDKCSFLENNIGVLVERCTSSSTGKFTSNSQLHVRNTVFRGHLGCAALYVTGSLSASLSAREDASGVDPTVTEIGNDVSNGIVSHSFFEDNTNGSLFVENCGDLEIAKNLFLDEVRCGENGFGNIHSNFFVNPNEKIAFNLLDDSHSVIHHNIIRGVEVAMSATTKSAATCFENNISNVNIGVDCHTGSSSQFIQNLIMDAADCGIRASGGTHERNEVVSCPVGVVINQQVASATGRKALVFSGNTVHTCDNDGILVAGGGTIEGNTVYGCRQNINIVCTISSGSDAKNVKNLGNLPVHVIPHVHKNTVMDGNAGILISSHSVAIVTSNDSFDNTLSALIVEPAATCVVESNHFSCPTDRGAVDVAPDAQCQMHHNTIRNQFSPAYNKGLTTNRAKEQTKHMKLLLAKQSESDNAMGNAMVVSQQLLRQLDDVQFKIEVAAGRNTEGRTSISPGAVWSGRRDSDPTKNRRSSFTHVTSALMAFHESSSAMSSGSESPSTPSLKRARSNLGRLVSGVKSTRDGASKGGKSSSAASAKKLQKQQATSVESKTAGLKTDTGVTSILPPKKVHVIVHVVDAREKDQVSSLNPAELGNLILTQLASRSTEATQFSGIVTTGQDPVNSIIKMEHPQLLLVVVCGVRSSDGEVDEYVERCPVNSTELEALHHLHRFIVNQSMASRMVLFGSRAAKKGSIPQPVATFCLVPSVRKHTRSGSPNACDSPLALKSTKAQQQREGETEVLSSTVRFAMDLPLFVGKHGHFCVDFDTEGVQQQQHKRVDPSIEELCASFASDIPNLLVEMRSGSGSQLVRAGLLSCYKMGTTQKEATSPPQNVTKVAGPSPPNTNLKPKSRAKSMSPAPQKKKSILEQKDPKTRGRSPPQASTRPTVAKRKSFTKPKN